MCISCRGREAQQNLLRLSCVDKEPMLYIGKGRSFYLCKTCITGSDASDNKRLIKSLARECKTNPTNFEQLVQKLKEIAANER